MDNIILDLNSKAVDAVIAIGGGTVMDTGKAVSAMLCMSGSIVDYLEGVGTKEPVGKRKPLICIPTTSGTGSEATKNAVVTKIGKDGFKKSLRHKAYIPDTVIIDPELIVSCPKALSLAAGMDAVTQLLESYVSTKSTPFTDMIALNGLTLAGKSLPLLAEDGSNIDARSDMAYAAYLSGIGLANAGAALTGSKYNSSEKNIDLLINTLNYWVEDFNISKFSEYGFTKNDMEYAAKKTGLKNTSVELNEKDIYSILISRF